MAAKLGDIGVSTEQGFMNRKTRHWELANCHFRSRQPFLRLQHTCHIFSNQHVLPVLQPCGHFAQLRQTSRGPSELRNSIPLSTRISYRKVERDLQIPNVRLNPFCPSPFSARISSTFSTLNPRQTLPSGVSP